MSHIVLTPTYILHTRPFRNTSLLIDFFSQRYGRISAIARSARGMTSRYQGKLQLFTPMLVSWFGQHELKSLGEIELSGMPLHLNHQPLFCAFYLNELLMRVLHREDPYPLLFQHYHDALKQLEKGNFITATLRLFEKRLLTVLGYGFPFEKINSNDYYHFNNDRGFLKCASMTGRSSHEVRNSCQSKLRDTIFFGADLMSIAAENFHSETVLQSAKRLMRLALAPLLNDKPIHSRGFFE